MRASQTTAKNSANLTRPWALIGAAAAAGLAVLLFVTLGNDDSTSTATVRPKQSPMPSASREPEFQSESVRPRPRAANRVVSTVRPSSPSLPAPPQPEATTLQLEQRFRASRDRAAQIEIVEEIAGRNDAAAVRALARLFPGIRHPEVKEALIARLGDIDPEAASDERFRTLDSALRSQARSVRSAAIDVLAQSEEPQALALLRRSAHDDSDSGLRESAREILKLAEQNQ